MEQLDNVGRNLRRAARQAMNTAINMTGSGRGTPLLASVNARPSAASKSPTFNPESIKARLSSVPVYAVVNKKNEFVLVSGEDDVKQLGLFFFSEPEAEAMLKTIKEANPKVGKQAKVMTTSMDRVYDFATTPRTETGTEGVIFRFMPDPRQVDLALQLYRHSGVAATGFQGVPLFQAEGLSIRGEKGRYTPLFFSKDDLDEALGAAVSSKDAAAQADARAKAERARTELQEVEAEAAAAASGRDRKAAQRKAAQAKDRLQKYEQRIAEAEAEKKQKLPKVDVGSLEDVISRMERDEQEWSDVIFCPGAGGGLLSN
ncbi:hypothetical protein D9Q98_004006 [Chlorella vulgaris]|uniref:Uncharacterized protein n=1 Tax=Chlorella vulgaris TaxID=3077 RepID=A0A9D4TQY8_CHLVU|nr:hypothetical protein D9Q98_004006 [Chlorella vulgaris]